MSPRALGLACAAGALALNVMIERALMGARHSLVLVPGLADFHPVWNRGVSFSLLAQDTNRGRYLLLAGLALLILGVAVMTWRSTNAWAAAGWGLVLGGAAGNNLIDRAVYGGVFDFLYLHLGDMPLFVCNFADIAISAGVVVLLAESVLVKPKPH